MLRDKTMEKHKCVLQRQVKTSRVRIWLGQGTATATQHLCLRHQVSHSPMCYPSCRWIMPQACQWQMRPLGSSERWDSHPLKSRGLVLRRNWIQINSFFLPGGHMANWVTWSPNSVCKINDTHFTVVVGIICTMYKAPLHRALNMEEKLHSRSSPASLFLFYSP